MVCIWPAKKSRQVWRPPEGFTGNMLIPVQRKMGVSGSSPTDISMCDQSLCHCLGQMPNQGTLPWALQSKDSCAPGSSRVYTTVVPPPTVWEQSCSDCMGTWQQSIENIYTASPVFQGGYQLNRYNGSRICFWLVVFCLVFSLILR